MIQCNSLQQRQIMSAKTVVLCHVVGRRCQLWLNLQSSVSELSLYAVCVFFVSLCYIVDNMEEIVSVILCRIVKDERFERLPCLHAGTYADDCLVQRVTQVTCFSHFRIKFCCCWVLLVCFVSTQYHSQVIGCKDSFTKCISNVSLNSADQSLLLPH